MRYFLILLASLVFAACGDGESTDNSMTGNSTTGNSTTGNSTTANNVSSPNNTTPDDPCATADCGQLECVSEGSTARCVCPPGSSPSGDGCEPDVICMPTTCNDRGECSDSGGEVTCSCREGATGEFCEECDEANGWVDDGNGGCRNDPCLPNPCDQPDRSVCDGSSGVAECLCDLGFHDEAGVCVADEVCDVDSCANGTCSVEGGVRGCACDTGFVGPTCAECDTANGFHPDGVGGCTTDPCLPNPCAMPNKTECQSNGQSFVCSCDPGFHPDGAGGCTDDPCLPDTCIANNQACRDDGNGQPECYTPTCFDMNPCTDDILVQGICQFIPIADGSACSTSACLIGELCAQGTCTGGTLQTCDDGNQCTDDTCDTVLGCQFAPDDTNVPDDGVACTTDTCSGGLASNTPTDSICDDGLFCTGVDACAPADPSADGRGCVVTSVPQATGPPLGPCANYVCDETSSGFIVQNEPAGTPCDDGQSCTTNDLCDIAGACGGTQVPQCTTACTSTHPLGPVDLNWAELDVTVTFEGQDPEVSLPPGSFSIYAFERDTGARILIARYQYSLFNSDPLVESVRILPGTYDIVFSSAATPPPSFPMNSDPTRGIEGMVSLQKGVVLAPGSNSLALDVDPAAVAVTVTYEGQDPEVALPFYDFNIFAVEVSTGAWMKIADYDWSRLGSDKLLESNRLMPGTYDLLYSTSSGSDFGRFTMTTDATSVPEGMVYLQRGVAVTEGTNLVVDVDPATIGVTVTYEGADPEVSGPTSDFQIFAREQQTGATVLLADYDATFGATDALRENIKMVPGTYDIFYDTRGSFVSDRYAMTTNPTAAASGVAFLQRDVVISDGSSVVVDVDPAAVTVDVTYEGTDPETSAPYNDFYLYAVEQDTGAWVQIARYNWSAVLTNTLQEGVKLMPGTYDILYSTWAGPNAGRFAMTTDPTVVPEGIGYLVRDVIVGEGSNIVVDVDAASVAVDVTYQGADPEVTQPLSNFFVVAVEQTTRAWVVVAEYDWLASSDQLRETTRILPGTYDIWYATAGPMLTTFGLNADPAAAPTGVAELARDLVITDGTTIAVDIAPSTIAPAVTTEGTDPEVSVPFGSFDIFAVERSSGAWVRIADYDWGIATTDKLRESSRIMPGTYDLLYSTTSNMNFGPFPMTTAAGTVPSGVGYLDRCVSL